MTADDLHGSLSTWEGRYELRIVDTSIMYHVLNRTNARMTIFRKDADYQAFEDILHEAVDRTGMRLLAYCLTPNHWHLLVWPA